MDREVRFEQIYRQHGGAVRAYALRRTDATRADDVLAEVFVVVWRRLDEVPAQPLPWLLGVARRALANQLRSERRTTALRDRVASDVRPASPNTKPALGHDVRDALSALGERDREVLLLHAWEDLGPGDIGKVLGITRGAAAVRLHRARRRAAAALDASAIHVEVTG